MAQDVSGDVADLIGDAKTFGSSENIRHGTYKFLVKRIYAQLVENDKGQHKMAFWELMPLESKPNPQFEGDRVDYVSPTQLGTGPLRDDGTKPNSVGSNCALKVDFDGAGGRSAGSNIKDAILALFNKRAGEITNDEVKSTWKDLSRERDLHVGDAIGIDPKTNQPILATKAKKAQPACGLVINCTTMTRKKKTPNEKGMYITKLIWSCAAPIGTGENANELVAKRRAEIEAAMPDEEEEDTSTTPPRTGPINAPQNTTAPSAPQPPAPPAPPAPPPPTSAAFTPPPPWIPLPNHPVGLTPDQRWYWSPPAAGGTNEVKSEVQLRG